MSWVFPPTGPAGQLMAEFVDQHDQENSAQTFQHSSRSRKNNLACDDEIPGGEENHAQCKYTVIPKSRNR